MDFNHALRGSLATHESEEEPDVIAEDAEKAVHRTFEGKKARKKQWSGGRDSRTIRAEKEFAQKEKERLARDAERLAREAAKPKLLEALSSKHQFVSLYQN